MRSLAVLIILSGIMSCTGKEDTEKAEPQTSSPESISAVSIPELGTLDLAKQWMDSTHAYGAGDCFGDIYHYTKDGIQYAVDSMTCGEYGFTFRHYLLSEQGTISGMREFKWESVPNRAGDNYIHIIHEYVYNLVNEPAQLFQRTDTLQEHYTMTGFPLQVDKPFVQHELEATPSLVKLLQDSYDQAWQRELVEY